MTMPHERSLALLWAGGFLIEVARDERVPVDVRQAAVHIARHFPTVEDVASMSMQCHPKTGYEALVHPRDLAGWEDECQFGGLRYSTRLDRPAESS